VGKYGRADFGRISNSNGRLWHVSREKGSGQFESLSFARELSSGFSFLFLVRILRSGIFLGFIAISLARTSLFWVLRVEIVWLTITAASAVHKNIYPASE
jgi:hypothetical protein